LFIDKLYIVFARFYRDTPKTLQYISCFFLEKVIEDDDPHNKKTKPKVQSRKLQILKLTAKSVHGTRNWHPELSIMSI